MFAFIPGLVEKKIYYSFVYGTQKKLFSLQKLSKRLENFAYFFLNLY